MCVAALDGWVYSSDFDSAAACAASKAALARSPLDFSLGCVPASSSILFFSFSMSSFPNTSASGRQDREPPANADRFYSPKPGPLPPILMLRSRRIFSRSAWLFAEPFASLGICGSTRERLERLPCLPLASRACSGAASTGMWYTSFTRETTSAFSAQPSHVWPRSFSSACSEGRARQHKPTAQQQRRARACSSFTRILLKSGSSEASSALQEAASSTAQARKTRRRNMLETRTAFCRKSNTINQKIIIERSLGAAGGRQRIAASDLNHSRSPLRTVYAGAPDVRANSFVASLLKSDVGGACWRRR